MNDVVMRQGGSAANDACSGMFYEFARDDKPFLTRVVRSMASQFVGKELDACVVSELLDYAECAVELSAPFDAETIKKLTSLSDWQVAEAARALRPKLSDRAREIHRQATLNRPSDERVEQLLQGGDTCHLPFHTDRRDLVQRIDAAIRAHNYRVEMGLDSEFGKAFRLEGEDEYVEYETVGRAGRTSRIRLGRFLERIRAWDVVDDLQMLTPAEIATTWGPDYETGLASRMAVRLDDVPPQRLRLVVSRDPDLIGECSTGQRWTSCFAEGHQKFEDVAGHIRAGSLVVYLADYKDTTARYPHMRQLLVPFESPEGERIYVPDRDCGTWNSVAATATRDRFRNAVFDIAQRLNSGRSGTFRAPKGLWVDDTSQKKRIVEWGVADLDREIGRTLDGRVNEKVKEIKIYYGVLKKVSECAKYAHLASVIEEAFGKAGPVVVDLSEKYDRHDVQNLIVRLRDANFVFAHASVEWRDSGSSLVMMEAVVEEFLQNSVPPSVWQESRLAFEPLLAALSLESVPGDVLAAMLLACLWRSRESEGHRFDAWPQLGDKLSTVCSNRSRHIGEIARRELDSADTRLNAARRELWELDDIKEVKSLSESFRKSWWSLKHAVQRNYGPAAWHRLEELVAEDGLDIALTYLENQPSRCAGRMMAIVWAVLPKSMRAELRAAILEVREQSLPAWKVMEALLCASPHCSNISEINKFVLWLLKSPVFHDDELVEMLASVGVRLDRHHDSKNAVAAFLLPTEVIRLGGEIEHYRDIVGKARERVRNPAEAPDWIGAASGDLRLIAWLSDPDTLVARRDEAFRAATRLADAEVLAHQTFSRVRRNNHAELPDPEIMIRATDQALRDRFPELFS